MIREKSLIGTALFTLFGHKQTLSPQKREEAVNVFDVSDNFPPLMRLILSLWKQTTFNSVSMVQLYH